MLFDKKKSLEAEKQERLSLVTHSLLSAIYQNRYHKVGIEQLFNRFFALVQQHIVITVLDKDEDKNSYKVIFHTMQDPLWKNLFEMKLQEEGHVREDHIYLSEEKGKKPGYRFQKNRFLRFYRVEFTDKDGQILTEPVFKPYTKERLEELLVLKFLDNIIDEEANLLSSLTLSEELNERFDLRSRCWDNGHFNARNLKSETGDNGIESRPEDIEIEFEPTPHHVHEILKNAYVKWPDTFFDETLREFEEIFEAQYQNVNKSPLFRKRKSLVANEPLANMIFCSRFFTRDVRRFSDLSGKLIYPYDLKTFLPKTQKKQLENTLRVLDRKRICDDQMFKGEQEFFWDALAANRYDEILKAIEAPRGENCRALSDMVLGGGFVRFVHNKCGEKGIHRVTPGIWEKSQECHSKDIPWEYKSLVYQHYFDIARAPYLKSASTMLVPILVAGSPWASISFLYDRHETQSHESWIDVYHYYHSIAHYMQSDIRARLHTSFLNVIKKLYFCTIHYFRHNTGKLSSDLDANLIAKTFNHLTKMVCRLYPHNHVCLETEFDANDPHGKDIYPFGDKCHYRIRLNRNPYFTQAVISSYVTIEEIWSKFNEAEIVSNNIFKEHNNDQYEPSH